MTNNVMTTIVDLDMTKKVEKAKRKAMVMGCELVDYDQYKEHQIEEMWQLIATGIWLFMVGLIFGISLVLGV